MGIQGGNAYSVLKNTASAKAVATDERASDTTSRRNLLRSAAALSAGALLGSVNPGIALADDDVATPVYFGVGCFWHIQHEFVIQGEKDILGRGPSQYTSAAG